MLMEAASAASSVFLYPQPAIFRRLHSLGGNRSAKTLLRRVPHLSRLSSTARAADSTQHAPPVAASSSKTVVPDNDFSLAKVSFGVIGLAVGGTLLSYGFGAYFTILPGSEWSALMLTYGFPLAIIGMALQYAELKPVPCITYSDAETLRETCATPILKQENGIVEKKNQTILDVAKTMPKSKDLLKELWAEVVDCAVYLLNWYPTKSLEYVTLQEAWSGRRVMFSYLEVFGRIAYSRPTKKEGKAR